jgi:hypothetical protein
MQSSSAFHDVVGLRLASQAASPGGLNPQNEYRSISAILGQHFKKRAMASHGSCHFVQAGLAELMSGCGASRRFAALQYFGGIEGIADLAHPTHIYEFKL